MRKATLRWKVIASCAFAATATSGLHAKDLSEADSARSRLRAVFECVAVANSYFREGKGIVSFIDNSHDPKELAKLQKNMSSCLWQTYHGDKSIALRFSPEILRGELFRGLLLQRVGFSTRRKLLPDLQRIADAPRDIASNPMGAFGLCVASIDPDNARAAIDSRTASEEEDNAYRALMPALSQCIAPGDQLAFSKQVLEGALAEGLFVLTYSTKQQLATRASQ